VEGGDDVFRTSLPERLVYVMGAEGEGMDRGLAGVRPAGLDSRQRRGGEPERGLGHGGAAGAVGEPPRRLTRCFMRGDLNPALVAGFLRGSCKSA
jgi:hypothetical protein